MILIKGLMMMMMMMICQFDDQVLMLTQPNYFGVKEGIEEERGGGFYQVSEQLCKT